MIVYIVVIKQTEILDISFTKVIESQYCLFFSHHVFFINISLFHSNVRKSLKHVYRLLKLRTHSSPKSILRQTETIWKIENI